MDLEEIYLSFKGKCSKELSRPLIDRDNKIMKEWLQKDIDIQKEKKCICGNISNDDFCEKCNENFGLILNDKL